MWNHFWITFIDIWRFCLITLTAICFFELGINCLQWLFECLLMPCISWNAFGRAVASDTRDPWFKSSHWQILFTINCIKALIVGKTKIKKECKKKISWAKCKSPFLYFFDINNLYDAISWHWAFFQVLNYRNKSRLVKLEANFETFTGHIRQACLVCISRAIVLLPITIAQLTNVLSQNEKL